MFKKEERSSFPYWFAHWCAFQMTALNLHCWKPKYLLHDIEKPWLMWWWNDYKSVQKYHRTHNNHHMEYSGKKPMDWEAMVIDNECSRFTKQQAPLTAVEWYKEVLKNVDKNANKYGTSRMSDFIIEYRRVYERLGLWK